MSGFWRGYANVNDDVRHTLEQVFFDRQTTGNLTEYDVPGMKPEQQQGDEPNYPFHPKEGEILPPEQASSSATVQAEGPVINQDMDPLGRSQHAHAALYESIWGNSSSAGTDGPSGAPAIEGPKIEPPNQGDDLTPGH